MIDDQATDFIDFHLETNRSTAMLERFARGMRSLWGRDGEATTSQTAHGVPSRVPMYFLDADSQGELFVQYVHVTSSVNASAIRSAGLQPLGKVRDRLVAYLTKTFPKEDAETLLAEIEQASGPARYTASLVTMRLQEEREGRGVVALLPLGATFSIPSVAENAVEDGGEVFKAARETVNTLRGWNVGAPYPDAKGVVFVARHNLMRCGSDLSLMGLPDVSVHVRDAVESGFAGEWWSPFAQDMPIHVTKPYAPDDLQCMGIDEYLCQPMKAVSPKARQLVEAIYEDEPPPCPEEND